MHDFVSHIPADLIKFLLVTVFSLLIGLEQRRHYSDAEYETLFGTDRTFTLIGILGYILYLLSPVSMAAFLAGGGIVAGFLSIYYFQKTVQKQRFGITSIVIALITYCLAPLIYTQPQWLVLLIVISLLIITEMKNDLMKFSKRFDRDEFVSLAKFLVLTGVILPLLPDEPISAAIAISPYHFWLAIVVVSTISYLSYLLRKFVFPNSGMLLTGFLGGLYSSTATTVILAKKSKNTENKGSIPAAIFLAITMMYLRIFAFALFFNAVIAFALLPYFIGLILVCIGLVVYFNYFAGAKELTNGLSADSQTKSIEANDTAVKPVNDTAVKPAIEQQQNPLEFKTALLFGGLFVVFAVVTGSVINQFGSNGISILSFVVGVTDIDPFLLSLFQGKWTIGNSVIIAAVLNAMLSNNILKFIYAYTLSEKSIRKSLVIGFGVLLLASAITVLLPH